MLEIQFKRKFEAAHRFIEGENKGTVCSQPHGHTWFVTVTLTSKKPRTLNLSTNTLIPFEKAKKKWHQWIDNHVDHCFMFNEKDHLLEFMLKDNPNGRHLVTPGDPTTEMVAITFMSKFNQFLNEVDPDLYCTSIVIDETQTNTIRFSGNPQEHLPQSQNPKEFWWNRSDFSISDLNNPK